MSAPSKEQIKAALGAVQAIAETIREVGEVPSGVLYAQLVGVLPDLASYERILGILKGAKLVVEETNHVLRWIGPQLEKAAPEPTTAPGRCAPCRCGDGSCMLCDDNGMVPIEGAS